MNEGEHSKTETAKRNLFESTTKVGKRVNQCARKIERNYQIIILCRLLVTFHIKQNGTP